MSDINGTIKTAISNPTKSGLPRWDISILDDKMNIINCSTFDDPKIYMNQIIKIKYFTEGKYTTAYLPNHVPKNKKEGGFTGSCSIDPMVIKQMANQIQALYDRVFKPQINKQQPINKTEEINTDDIPF